MDPSEIESIRREIAEINEWLADRPSATLDPFFAKRHAKRRRLDDLKSLLRKHARPETNMMAAQDRIYGELMNLEELERSINELLDIEIDSAQDILNSEGCSEDDKNMAFSYQLAINRAKTLVGEAIKSHLEKH